MFSLEEITVFLRKGTHLTDTDTGWCSFHNLTTNQSNQMLHALKLSICLVLLLAVMVIGTPSFRWRKSANTVHSDNLKRQNHRRLEDTDDYFNRNDDNQYKSNTDDAFNALDVESECVTYLFSFLRGTGVTDGKDTCEGILNAYRAASCHNSNNIASYSGYDDDQDDYFASGRGCCETLKSHYDSYCDSNQIITSMHLLLIGSVLLLCEMAKAFIKSNKIHWLPEAGGCMLVGTLVGAISRFVANRSIDDLSFDEDLFLCVLLPPIIFEAALSVNKKEFRRRRLAIMMFAVFGTILSTFMTGYMVHYASKALSSVTTIPLLDSLIFGSLISSIDPVAILSVLTSLHLTEEDTVYIMVFGESLLNDGIAITLFHSLISHYGSDSFTADEILGSIADFLIIGLGSVAIGIICGFAALIYFWVLKKQLNPTMEVASFFLWAGIPYYICDEFELSGIVSIVTIGFFMDIYITTPKHVANMFRLHKQLTKMNNSPDTATEVSISPMAQVSNIYQPPQLNSYINTQKVIESHDDLDVTDTKEASPYGRSTHSMHSLKSFKSLQTTLNLKELLLREEKFRLSKKADKHVRFVAHLLAQLSENCIFVYLGLFLFSKKYVWEAELLGISVTACILSRALMVVIICTSIWYINIFRQKAGCYKPTRILTDDEPQVSRTAAALQDRSVQLVLVLSGLRGAVSLALVESVPIYNSMTNSGSEYKGYMKAMTSGSIIFTIFVFGGSAYYILRNLNIKMPETEKQFCIDFSHSLDYYDGGLSNSFDGKTNELITSPPIQTSPKEASRDNSIL
jgi:NhaP-type Na+/H+ or K+/H+ antiporter